MAWLKFSVLLLISKVMRQRCVIIENLTWCPPISHPGRLGHRLTRQLNVPGKQDKTVINAKSLCLLSCSEDDHCHCLLACSQRVQNGKNETRIEWKSIVTVGSIISLSFHVLWLCVSENRLCICSVNHLHYLYFVFSCSHVSSAYTVSLKWVQRKRFKEKTISQSE